MLRLRFVVIFLTLLGENVKPGPTLTPIVAAETSSGMPKAMRPHATRIANRIFHLDKIGVAKV